MDKQTSDERLLKLIEGTADSKRQQIIPAGVKRASTNFAAPKLNLFELKSKIKNLAIDLRSINKGLIALSVLLTLIFLYTLFSAPEIPKSNAAFFTPEDSSAIVKLISAGQAQGLIRKSISAQAVSRDFFLPAGSKNIVNTQEDGQDLTEEVKTLKLVGIIWSQNPEVMIENSKDSRTYTLKKGDSLDEQFKVKEISRSSATLLVTTPDGPKEYVLR